MVDDKLAPVRGIRNALLISGAFWFLVLAAIFVVDCAGWADKLMEVWK